VPITPNDWRWIMLVGAAPVVLGLFSLLAVPESPRWLAAQGKHKENPAAAPVTATREVFRPPLLWITLVGIILATTPVIGGWGTANWMIPWAEKAGSPELRAKVLQARAITGIVGSLIGGWVASVLGRRFTYFATSVASLLIAQYTFWYLSPTDGAFLFWVA